MELLAKHVVVVSSPVEPVYAMPKKASIVRRLAFHVRPVSKCSYLRLQFPFLVSTLFHTLFMHAEAILYPVSHADASVDVAVC